MIIDYDRRPNATEDEKLQSLVENIQLALNSIDAGTLTGEVTNNIRINAGTLNGTIDGDYLFVKNLDADSITAVKGWIDKLLVQTHLLANEGEVFELDAIQVNASRIKTGTLDVERLIYTNQTTGEKYLVHFDPDGSTAYEKLDGNVIEDLTITADKIVSESIMARHITTQNLEGTGGWINLRNGTFFYGNGATYAAANNAISWDGSKLKIKADDFELSSGKSIFEEIEAIETWFYAVAPTTSNEPAKNWNTEKLKELHLRDIYFDTTSGKSYRWAKDGTTYKWVEIEDVELAAVTRRLSDAETSITKNADSIVSLASANETYVKPDGTTATNKLRTQIKQNADAIALKANSTDVYTKAEADAAITVSAQGIEQRVSSTYQTKSDMSNYPTTTQMDSAISQSAGEITASVSSTYQTKSDMSNYPTTTQMDSAISQSAGEITASVSSTYETKTDASSKLNEAKGDATTKADKALTDAKADTTEKLKSYYTKAQTDSEISQKANEISLSVSEEKIAELISAKEASGDIVHIEDASEYPALDCKISLEPIQDLHGYDKPWVGGAGKNKLEVTASSQTVNGVTFTVNADGSVKVNGTATANTSFALVQRTAGLLASGNYLLNGNANLDSQFLLQVYSFTKSQNIARCTSSADASFSVDANEELMVVLYVFSGKTVNNLTVYPMIRLASDTDATWQPYSNICPISGRTEVVTSVSGFNVWDEEVESGGIYNDAGTEYASDSVYKSKNYTRIIPNTSYYVKNSAHAIANNVILRVFYYDANKNYISSPSGQVASKAYTTPSNAHYMRIVVNEAIANFDHTICINYPSTDHDYHAYNGQSYTTDLGRTVYGGEVEVVGGTLTDTHKSITINSDTNFTMVGATHNCYTSADDAKRVQDYKVSMKCDKMEVAQSAGDAAVFPAYPNWVSGYYYSQVSQNQNWIYWHVDGIESKADMIAWLAENPLQVVYELATPQTYQLTPQQIELLTGENNVWSDEGDTYLKYVTMNSDMLSLMDKSNADLSRAKAEIKVTTDGISSEVSKKVGSSEVISKINQSAETVKIQASKVEIDGATTFNAIKASADAAYDVKGAASAVQTNLDNLQIGGRNLVWDTEWNNISTRWTNWGSPTTREIVTANGKRWLHLVTTTTSYQGYSQGQEKRNGYGEIKAGDKVVISYSAYAKTAGQICTVGCHWKNSSGTIVAQNWFPSTLTTTEKRYISAVFTIPNNAVGFNVMVGDGTANAQELWISQVKIEFGTKATDWTIAPEDIEDAAVAEEQYIYISKASGTTSVSGTTTWVTETGDKQNTWTTKRPTYNTSYPVLFVAKQKKVVSGTVTCTTPVKDDTTTIIDGGHITTGTIDSNRLNADTIKVNAANIQGSLTIGQLPSTVAETSDIPTKVSELTNDSKFQTDTQVSTAVANEANARKATYATSSTAAGTQAKVAACSNFALYTGATITVGFTNANTHVTPTLNANSTGAKTIKNYTGAALTAAEYKWAAGAALTFVYDGSYWRMQDSGATESKAAAAASASTASTKASEAATSASTASTKASEAATSASTASTKASEASTSASTASSKATAAANSASTASTKASEASTSASTASSKATAAANSATAAENAKNVALDTVTVKDTRNDNQPPSWYISNYPKKRVQEFKSTSKIGLSGDTYCWLQTDVPWDDSSGGYPKQMVELNGKQYWRQGMSTSAWSAWVDAYGTAVESAKTATSYITDIDSQNGITIKAVNGKTDGSDDTKKNYIKLNTDGLDIYKGGASVAKYGDTARIGKDGQQRVEVTSSAVEIHDADGDLRLKTTDEGLALYGGTDSSNPVSTFRAGGAYMGNGQEWGIYLTGTEYSSGINLLQHDTGGGIHTGSVVLRREGNLGITADWGDINLAVPAGHAVNVSADGLIINGHTTGVGSVLSATASKAITTAGIDTYTQGASIKIPIGTWVITGSWQFNTGSSSGARNLGVVLSTSSRNANTGILARQRVYAHNNAYAQLQVVYVGEFEEETTVYVKGASSMTYTSAATTEIRAVRIA